MAKKRKGKGNKKRELDIGAIQDAFTQKLLFAAFAIKEEDAVRRVRTLCANETERIVETALRQNAALDISGLLDNANCYGRTPLQYAAVRGHAAVVQQLIEAKASPNTGAA